LRLTASAKQLAWAHFKVARTSVTYALPFVGFPRTVGGSVISVLPAVI